MRSEYEDAEWVTDFSEYDPDKANNRVAVLGSVDPGSYSTVGQGQDQNQYPETPFDLRGYDDAGNWMGSPDGCPGNSGRYTTQLAREDNWPAADCSVAGQLSVAARWEPRTADFSRLRGPRRRPRSAWAGSRRRHQRCRSRRA